MNSQPTIRIAQRTDAEILQSLYRQLVNDENVKVTECRVEALAKDPNTHLLVCAIDGHVRGTVLVCLCADAMYAEQPFAVVENLVVDQECRGYGIGQALLREAERFCLLRNCSKMMLLSSVSRVNAHRFLERVGFRGDRKRGFVKYRSQFSEATRVVLSLDSHKASLDDTGKIADNRSIPSDLSDSQVQEKDT